LAAGFRSQHDPRIYVGVGSLVLIALKVLDALQGREPRTA